MSRSKLFEILTLVDSRIRKDLAVFVRMPSNQLSPLEQKIARQIFRILAKRRTLKEEKVFADFFQASEKAKWNRVKNHLYEVIKKYFILHRMEHQVSTQLEILNYFSQHQLPKTTKSLKKQIEQQIDRSPHPNKALHQYILQEMAGQKEKDARRSKVILDRMETSLDIFYFEHKLRIICEQFNRAKIVNTATTSYEDLLKYLYTQTDYIHSSKINLYLNLLRMITTKSNPATYYQSIKITIETPDFQEDQAFKKEITEQLMNFCIRAINRGAIHYAKDYILFLETLLLNKPNSGILISAARLKNYITACLVVNEVDKAKAFLEQYSPCLASDIRKDVSVFNRASIAFFEGDLEGCAEILKHYQPRDLYFDIAYRKLQAKIRCEELLKGTGDIHSFHVFLASQRKFIKTRRQLSSERQAIFLKALAVIERVSQRKKVIVDELWGQLPVLDIYWIKQKQALK